MKFLVVCLCLVFFELETTNAVIRGIRSEHQPHYVYLMSVRPDNTLHNGGGSLISNHHVLTSASNINGFVMWRCQMGSTASDRFMLLRDSTQALPHPEHNAEQFLNDIGIILITEPIEFTNLIRAVPLPPLSEEIPLPLVNEEGLIVGFGGQGQGLSNNLEAAFQRVTTNEACNRFVSNNVAAAFCGEDAVLGSNLCMGDQGGGFTVRDRNREILVGVISAPFCNEATISTYARITHFRRWINDVAQV